jgi:hypothetical protein
MHKTIYQYFGVASLTITPFFTFQVTAGECATGTAPSAGCTIGVDDTTYTMTGNIATASGYGIRFNSGSDGNTVTLTGSISTSGNSAYVVYLNDSDSNNTTINGNISTEGNNAYSLYIYGSRLNTTTINGNISTEGSNAYSLYLRSSFNTTTTITGNISTVGGNTYGMYLFQSDNNNTTINGNISTENNNAYGMYLRSSDSNTTTINGNISTENSNAYGMQIRDSHNNNTIINGNISTSASNAHGVYERDSTGNSITNLGTIATSASGTYGVYIRSGSALTTLNNKQSGLTYYGKVPTNYNIIIRGDADYGKTTFSTVSSTMTFGIDLTNSGTGIGDKTYEDVLTGIASSGVLSATTGSSGGASWSLAHDGTNWDLTISGALDGSYGAGGGGGSAPSAASTLTSIQSASYAVASQFSGYAMSTNYANLNTYDCGLFDQDGGCFSVGGRYSDVNGNNSSDASSNALVAVGGFKINDNLRVAGFVDQQVNSIAPAGIKLDNKGPMLGMSLVWNQHPDHLGYQVKVANAYQSKAITITRSAVGDAEAGRGDTEVQVQSYVAEVSYQFSDGVKTSYRPYAALRRAIIKQNAYTETGVDSPLTFNTLEDKSTTVIMGMKSKYKFNDKFTLNGAVGVEHDVSSSVDQIQATSSAITGLTPVDLNTSVNKTRPVATLGATYHITPNQSLSAQTQYQELSYTSTSAKTAYFNYSVGF